MRILFALLLLLCSFFTQASEVNKREFIRPHITVTIPPTTYQSEAMVFFTAQVNAAIVTWNYIAGDPTFIRWAEEGEIADIIITPAFIPSPGILGIAAVDFNNPLSGCVVQIQETHLLNTRTFVHEVGHCLGFQHSDEGNSIMQPFDDPGNWITYDLMVKTRELIRRAPNSAGLIPL